MTAVSLGSSIACISKVSINAAGVSIIGKFRCPGVSYDIGRSPFSLSKILLKKIVLSFSPFGNPFLELVGVGALRGAQPTRQHYWCYIDLSQDKRGGHIEDNRYVITNLIQCQPDTPRVVPFEKHYFVRLHQ